MTEHFKLKYCLYYSNCSNCDLAVLVRLKTNLDHADVQSRNVKQVDFIKFDHLKPKKHGN